MEKTVLSMPALWADHHVLKVREVLTALEGVEDVYASAAWKHVVVTHNAMLEKPAIVEALANAGYIIEEELGLEGKRLTAGDPQWDELGVRVTRTNQRDLELSGDFRRY